ncbi:hypothetical protein Pcinc_031307 [Petrolisthes cinctipes]|uniref:Uncharacterized protein n=1 Tax=Petrolisthes cinctipes TaxID=88211 RepID=A0AAE1K4Q6_PETCI|nr:hypothetical protein Pcinc_031307 [Petrolisthes cinctipes]
MRVLRALLGGCVGVVAMVVVLATLTSTPPTAPAIHSIVTHNLKEELEGKMACDRQLLERLGLMEEGEEPEGDGEEVDGQRQRKTEVGGPILYPHHTWDNLSTPVIASAVWSSEVGQMEGLVGMVQGVLPNLTLVIYTLDLTTSELQQVEETCNSTSTPCLTLPFDFSPFPAHVRDPRLKAFRPIIVQELLVRAGAVLWLDSGVRLAGSSNEGLVGAEGWGDLALRGGGVLTWPLSSSASLPSAALTHPNMFAFFKTKKQLYDFQLMGDAGTVLVYNTPGVHHHLMLPWVSCALTHNCISPIGAQDTGCRFDKKPLFRYSGCHHYDASAFNVALGVMFSYDTRPYLAPTSPFTRTTAPTTSNTNSGDAEEMEEETEGEDVADDERRLTGRGVSLDRVREGRGRVRTGIKREIENGDSSTHPKLSRDKQEVSQVNETKLDTRRQTDKLEWKRETRQH